MDLRHFPQWRYLRSYHTVACIRHPYARLASACREYYRQYSRETQIQMLTEPPSEPQLLAYLVALPAALEAHDLRYVHGFPITWFTHYGARPMVDSLLRLDQLHDDVTALAERCALTPDLRDALLKAVNRGQPQRQAPSLKGIQENLDLQAMSNLLHREDFPTFGFKMSEASASDPGLINLLDACLNTSASHQVVHTSLASQLRWYWGRSSNIDLPPLSPTRVRSAKPAPNH